MLDQKTEEWYNSHEWLNGLKRISDKSINGIEFSKQKLPQTLSFTGALSSGKA
ncbi:MAG: hypothetical protein ABI683_03260 [Ginsengibacter sp.]